jgi:hypothetical protein
MYGMINKAVQELVTTKFGEDKWREIHRKANVTEPAFINMVKYPDEMTYRLVGAASEVLGAPPEAIMEAFGEYWTVYSAEKGFGYLLDFAGDNIVDFLTNLDNMHTRVALTFPDLEPPSFRVTEQTPSSVRLHYYSKRAGLGPVVIGMIKGLGKRLNTPVTVKREKSRNEGHDHDEFLITFGESARAMA